MSIIYILLCLSAVGSLKIPKRGDEFQHTNEADEQESTSSDDGQIGFTYDDDDGPEEVLDSVFVDDPTIPGPSHGRILPRRVIGVPMPIIPDPALPGPSFARGMPYRTVHVPIPSLLSHYSPSSSTTSLNEETYDVDIHSMPMVDLLSEMPLSTSTDSDSERLIASALSNGNANAIERATGRANKPSSAENTKKISSLSEDSTSLTSSDDNLKKFDESVLDLISSLSTLTSSSSNSDAVEQKQQPASTSSTNIFEPPILIASQGPIEFVDDHFDDKPAPAVRDIPSPPHDGDAHFDSSSSSTEVLDTTSSTNITSGYQSVSTMDLSAASNQTLPADPPHDDANTSGEENVETLESIAIGKTYTSLNVAYSPFEALTRVLRTEKSLIESNSFLRWILNTGITKNTTSKYLDSSERKTDYLKRRKYRQIMKETENSSHKEIESKTKKEDNDKILKLKGTTQITVKNSTADNKKQEANNMAKILDGAHIPEDLCSEPVESLAQKMEKYNMDMQGPIWHSYPADDQNSKREELHISEVTSEGSIQIDRQIEEWVSLEGHAVGRGNHGLTLVTSYPQGVQVDHIEMDGHITSTDIFQWWNPETSTKSIGLIVAQDTTIYWYQLQEDNQLIQLWYWVLNEPINALKIFQIDGKWKLAVSYEQNYGGDCALAIYGLDLWQRYWFEQRLNGCQSLTLANEGRYIIAVHHDLSAVFIHRYNPEQRLYVNIQNVSSPGVRHVSAFTAGPYSFLAIGGDNSAIYQLRRDQMIKQTIRDYLLDHVEVWLPINVGYYRNDVILLVQHRLHYDSHYSNAIEALRWYGEQFSLMEHAPCRSHNDEMYGFICLTDAENERGIQGATVFRNIRGNIFIILATHEFSPSMFEIRTKMTELVDPVEEKLSLIQEYAETLKQKLINQFRVIEEAKKIKTKRNEDNYGLINADNLRIKELIAPAIRLHGNLRDFLKINGNINVAGKNMNHLDLELDVTGLFQKIKSNSLRIEKLKQKVEKAMNVKNGMPKTLRNVKMKGKFFTNGKTIIKTANVETINSLNTDHVLKHAMMKPKDGKLRVRGKQVVKRLLVDNIDADVVNGFDMMNPLNSQGPLLIYGDLTMQNHVKIVQNIILSDHGKMNNINLKKDMIVSGKEFATNDPLRFEKLKINHLFVDHVNDFLFTKAGLKDLIENSPPNEDRDFFKDVSVNFLTVGKNLHFETINGLPWKDLMDRIVMKTDNVDVDYLRVDGKITIHKKLKMDYLNTLRYPQDYFIKNEASAIQVTGAKIFESQLFVGEVDCEGKVSGIPHDNIVTLSTNQNLNNFTFYDLTVTERMTVDGEITGKELDAFLSNPLLTETRNIKSNVIFKNLVVNGNIMVEKMINGTHWKEIFVDVVEKSDKELTIDSTKIFKGSVTASKGINVQSGFINDKRIKNIMTVDTEQDTFVENIQGNIMFENLNVVGTVDEVNISKLVENSVSLFQNQSINTHLIFDDDLSVIEAKTLEVTETLNNQKVTEMMSKTNLILNSPVFNSLYVDQLIVEGDIENSWSLSGVNLHEFEQTRLSKTKQQVITAPYTINNCNVNELYFKYLNDRVNDEIYTNLKKITDLESNVLNGNEAIRNLHVIGNLDVSFVNNVDVNRLIEDAVVLNRENIITSPITFIDPVHLRTLQINGKSYGKNFDKFLHDVVRKSDKDVTFEGKKTFVNGMNVKGDVITNYLNNIERTQILTSNTDQYLEGTLTVIGNVTSERNIQINGFVNGIQMNDVAESFKYLGNNTYHLKGNIFFENESSIRNLNVKGTINNEYDLKDILNNAIYKSSDNNFTNRVTFNKPLIIRNALNVKDNYNGVYVGKLINDVVFITPNNESNFINSTVVFQQPVEIKGSLSVDNNLEAKTVNGIPAVYMDNRQTILGHDITAKSINRIPEENPTSLVK